MVSMRWPKFMPTFEPASSRVVLRVGSMVPPGIPGERYVSLLNYRRLESSGRWILGVDREVVGDADVARAFDGPWIRVGGRSSWN